MLGITNYQGNATQNHREISSHTCQDDCYQKAKRYVLVRMQRNGNPCALLVGMQTGTAITKNGMKIPSGIYPKEIKSASWRHTHIPMFTVPLLHNGKDMEITQGSINGWMDKENGGWRYTCIYTYICVHTHTHTHTQMVYTVLFFKKKETLTFMIPQVNLENIRPSETSQTQKDNYKLISPVCGI